MVLKKYFPRLWGTGIYDAIFQCDTIVVAHSQVVLNKVMAYWCCFYYLFDNVTLLIANLYYTVSRESLKLIFVLYNLQYPF